ncbi:sensor histidine kinase [Paenibacillus filicis]|uniref:histidine kinase n=1 Tax=Paenibacillus gyeongsangnamensis TaxID=3388067 RepID=A0ABT4QBL3_9BACL|nr:sensor histidine kinase [Paenibacillus filicis]MCZ8514147.1 sensor histidine kinase [Paenibacillus filicis]
MIILRSLWGRLLLSLALLIAMHKTLTAGPAINIGVGWLVLLSYLALFWYPRDRWSPAKLAAAAVWLGSLHLFNVLALGSGFWNVSMQLLLIAYTAVRERSSFGTWLSAAIALEIALLSLYFGDSLLSQVWFLMSIAGVYFGVRTSLYRSELYRSTQEHLHALQHAHAELQAATVASMQYAVLEERSRISRDIHDSLGHSLTSLIVQLQALQYMVKDGRPEAQEAVKSMLTVARQGLSEIRSAIHAMADDQQSLGLVSLRALVSQTRSHTNMNCTFQADETLELPTDVTVVLYRILQEALTNITRHAEASSVQVTVEQQEEEVHMEIADNGKLTHIGAGLDGFGLQGMKQRAAAAGGSCSFAVGNPGGMIVRVRIPMSLKGEETK